MDWKKKVELHHDTEQESNVSQISEVDLSELKIGQLIAALTPAQLWAIAGALLGTSSAIALIAYRMGVLFAGG
jgi:hypothetical protein